MSSNELRRAGSAQQHFKLTLDTLRFLPVGYKGHDVQWFTPSTERDYCAQQAAKRTDKAAGKGQWWPQETKSAAGNYLMGLEWDVIENKHGLFQNSMAGWVAWSVEL